MSEPGAGRARGRARGRAKEMPAAAGPGQRSTAPAPGQSQRPVAPAGAPRPQQAGPPPRMQAPPAQAQAPGRAASRPPQGDLPGKMQAMQIGGGNGNGGNGNGGDQVGRGAMRGRRQMPDLQVRTRPVGMNSKQGTSGKAVQLQSNYFKLETHTNWCLYQYRVDFAPEEDRTIVRKGLLKNHKEVLGGYIFDGTVMFTSHRLQPDPMELFSKRASDEENIRITVRLVADLAEGDAHYIQVFNILMRMALGYLNLQIVGRDYFDAAAKIEVREYKLELWPGYVTSIRQHESQIMMCSEILHKTMRQDTALDVLNDCVRKDNRSYRENFIKDVVGGIVLTDYNNHTYRIDDVDFSVSPKSTFSRRTGGEISYSEYYQTRYGINIRNADQPLLISRAKPRERRAGQSELIYLVPELCRMTGITDDMRSNFNLMRALADHTRVGPENRIVKLEKFNQRLKAKKDINELFQQWNLKLADNLVQFAGRVLPEEKIVQSAAGASREIKYNAGPQTDWTRELRSNPMLSIIKLDVWAVIAPGRCMRDAQSFITILQKSAQGMRFNMAQPYFHEIPDDKAGTYVEALERVIASKNPQLIMCVVTNNRADRYAAIKKKCCVDRAVPTQVMLAKNLNSKGVMSIATKVAIQINCKIGGAPWTVEIPLSGLMIAGFDVCHDTMTKGKSYGALVCSLDKPLTRYFSAVSAHTTGEELSNDLSINMTKALHKYREYNNGALPQRIVIYRDGVGEGQVPYVFAHEVELLKENLRKTYGGDTFKLAFIIVTKRINTRLFLGRGNPPPGTIADDCVTMPEKYDFYLVSQSVRQGTVAPTSYNIISDNVGLDPDKLQRLTYKLTHMYFNWSGTVRVPAPTQYAHKLAYLVGQFIHRPPTSQLEDSLYFL